MQSISSCSSAVAPGIVIATVEKGARLYRMLNGSGGQIDKLLGDSSQQGKPLSLLLDIPYDLNALPFELLNDGQFLAHREHSPTFIISTVTNRRSRLERIAKKRPLKVLFMTCSPLDLNAREVLSFEKEEELILSSVGHRRQADLQSDQCKESPPCIP